ncbi:hypothetical protein MHAE_15890 [Mycobacterium haemophilum DSM 44634]
MSPARSLAALNFKTEIKSHVKDGTGRAPCGRWSYARPGVNLAQGNLNSMPYFTVSAKFRGVAVVGQFEGG